MGVELEFGGLTPRATAETLLASLGGRLVEDSPHSFRITGSTLGDLTIELDVRHIHPAKYGDTLPFRLSDRSADLLGQVAGWAIPVEMITLPLDMARLPEVDGAVQALRDAGAVGTGDIGLRSFGLHFNPTSRDGDVDGITATLKAYVLLEGWLRLTVLGRRNRHLPGLAPPFPDPFVRKIAAPDYRPDGSLLIGDYLEANPTRKRGLDLLPLFLHMDEDRIHSALPREKIRKRPAFHYRLPLARVDRPGWSILPDWRRWLEVEALAADRSRLDALGRAYLDFNGSPADWAARAAPPQTP